MTRIYAAYSLVSYCYVCAIRTRLKCPHESYTSSAEYIAFDVKIEIDDIFSISRYPRYLKKVSRIEIDVFWYRFRYFIYDLVVNNILINDYYFFYILLTMIVKIIIIVYFNF